MLNTTNISALLRWAMETIGYPIDEITPWTGQYISVCQMAEPDFFIWARMAARGRCFRRLPDMEWWLPFSPYRDMQQDPTAGNCPNCGAELYQNEEMCQKCKEEQNDTV